MKFSRKRERGFSLLELVIVVVVVLIVSAMALPNMLNIIYNIRLRSSAQTIGGMMQTCRTLAVRDNTTYYVRTGIIDNATWVWVSKSPSNAKQDDEPQAILASSVVISNGNPSSPTVDWTPVPFILHKQPAFGARGLPCVLLGSICKTTYTGGSGPLTVGYEMYLTDSRPSGANGWAAIMLSPGGRIQTYTYDGQNWQH